MSSGRVPRPRAPEQVLEAGLELARVERRQAEVVEEVVAQLEVAELGAADEQQQRLEREVALAQRPAEGEGAAPGRRRRTTMAPAQPSSGSRRVDVASSADGLPRVAGQVERLGQLGRGRVGEEEEGFHQRAHQVRQVAVELELGDLGLVVDHSARLLRRNHSKMCSPSASATSSEPSITSSASDSDWGSGAMPSAARSSAVSSKTLADGLGRQLVALLDALEAGGEHHREGEVRVAGRVGGAVLDAGRGLLAPLGDRHPHQGRAVVAGPGHVDRRLVAGDEALVGVHQLVGDGGDLAARGAAGRR